MSNIKDIPKAYAAIVFLDNPYFGLLIILVTLYYPNIGIAGLIAAIVSYSLSKLLHFSDYARQTQLLNSALVGMSLGAFYQLNVYVAVLVILSAILVSLIAIAISDALWRWDGLPALSLPFVIVAALMGLAAQRFTVFSDYLGFSASSGRFLHPLLDDFFISLSAVYFVPKPVIGLLMFLGMLWVSRYLAFLAMIGYLIGSGFITVLGFQAHPSFQYWTSFNYILVAIAIGGIYTVPGLASLAVAAMAVLLTVIVVIASSDLVLVHGLPIMAVAFVSVTLLALSALRKRTIAGVPYLAPKPGLPEQNYENARLATVRYGAVNSVPLLLPFFGEWTVYQGMNGKHTHKDQWRYALDFHIQESGKSYSDTGEKLEDFYCYAAPVVSPVYGQVVRIQDQLPDNAPGEMDVRNNWGNFVLIQLEGGLFVLLAHLQKESIEATVGKRVSPGDRLARCGNSGRSPQPHLHMQVQVRAELGSPTHPFHLCSLMQYKDEKREYVLTLQPTEGDRISPTTADETLAQTLRLPVGHKMRFELQGPGIAEPRMEELVVETTLLGQMRLTSNSGASAAFEEINGVLACYDRRGPKDLLLDMWLLGNGLTPVSESASKWTDSPSANLIPKTIIQKLLMALLRPLGCGLDSRYERTWDVDRRIWKQDAQHQLDIGMLKQCVYTHVEIDPEKGYGRIGMVLDETAWYATLVETAMTGDQGIPAWTKDAFGPTGQTGSE